MYVFISVAYIKQNNMALLRQWLCYFTQAISHLACSMFMLTSLRCCKGNTRAVSWKLQLWGVRITHQPSADWLKTLHLWLLGYVTDIGLYTKIINHTNRFWRPICMTCYLGIPSEIGWSEFPVIRRVLSAFIRVMSCSHPQKNTTRPSLNFRASLWRATPGF